MSVVVIVALIPLLVLTVVNAGSVRHDILEQSERDAVALVQSVSNEQRHLFDMSRLRVEILAALPSVRGALSDPVACSATLLQAAAEVGNGYWFVLLDPLGDIVCASTEATTTSNFSDRSWFRSPLALGDFAAGSYEVSKIGNDPEIVLGTPVVFDGGDIGVLGHGVHLDWLADVLAETGLPEGVSLSVVDSNGMVLASIPDNRAGVAFEDTELFDAFLDRSSGILDRGRGGLSSFQPLADGIDGAFVAVTVATLPAYDAARGFLLRSMARLLLLMSLIAALLLWLTGSQLALPLRRLAHGYARVVQGEGGVRIPTTSLVIELATATQGFNHMTRVLGERTSQLQERAAYTQLLYTITSQVTDDIEQRLDRALELASELLGLDRGIVGIIDGDGYNVEHVHPPSGPVGRGQRLELETTFCSLITDDRPLVAVHDVGRSELAQHPCYLALGFESYIGVYLVVDGKPIGTLSFSAASPRRTPFSEVEREFVAMLARWVGSALERKRLDGELAASEARYRGVVTSLAEGVVLHGPEGEVLQANASAASILGRTHDQLLGRKLIELSRPIIHEDGSPLPIEEHPVLVTLRTGRPASGEVLGVPLPDGTVTWLLINTRLLADFGKPKTVVASFLDISERIRNEQAVAAEKLRFRAIFDSAFQFIGLMRPDGTMLEVNRAMLDFSGCEACEIVGRRLWELTSFASTPEQQAQLEAAVARAAAGEFVRHNVELRGAGGRVATADFSLKPVCDDQGKVVLIVPEGRVIDELIEVQRELEHNAAELERSNRELQQFAYVASHDLKEPLRVISGYVGLLERRYTDVLDDDGREFVAYAVDASARMAALIDALLEFSQVGAGAMQREQVPLDRVFASVRLTLASLIEESGAELTIGPLPTLVADEVQLVQLFQNLVVNAIKFRSDAPPRVDISAELLADVWRVSLRDNGIGIDQAYQERIFSLFQRLHTRERYDGTGIGLAVCKRIAERHGATIGVESDKNWGSVFHVDFPVGMVTHGSQKDRDLVG